MAVTPTGPISLPQSQCCDLLANSVTFQQRIGVASAADAYQKIFRTWKRLPTGAEFDQARPYAVVLSLPELEYQLDSGGQRNWLLPTGAVWIFLTDNDRFPGDVDDSGIDFGNFVGGVMQDIANQAAVDGNLAVIGVSLEAFEPFNDDLSAGQQPFWRAILSVHWQP